MIETKYRHRHSDRQKQTQIYVIENNRDNNERRQTEKSDLWSASIDLVGSTRIVLLFEHHPSPTPRPRIHQKVEDQTYRYCCLS